MNTVAAKSALFIAALALIVLTGHVHGRGILTESETRIIRFHMPCGTLCRANLEGLNKSFSGKELSFQRTALICHYRSFAGKEAQALWLDDWKGDRAAGDIALENLLGRMSSFHAASWPNKFLSKTPSERDCPMIGAAGRTMATFKARSKEEWFNQ